MEDILYAVKDFLDINSEQTMYLGEREEFFESVLLEMTSATVKNSKSSEYINLLNELSNDTDYLYRISDELQIETDDIRKKAYYLGYINCLLQYREIMERREDYDLIINKLHNAKYMNYFLNILNRDNVLSFSQLYQKMNQEYVNLTETNFSNFLKRYENYNLYVKKTEGKHRYYFISSSGRSIYQMLKENKHSSLNVNFTTEFTLDLLDNIDKEIRQSSFETHNILINLNKYEKFKLINKEKAFIEKIENILQHSKNYNDRDTMLYSNIDIDNELFFENSICIGEDESYG